MACRHLNSNPVLTCQPPGEFNHSGPGCFCQAAKYERQLIPCRSTCRFSLRKVATIRRQNCLTLKICVQYYVSVCWRWDSSPVAALPSWTPARLRKYARFITRSCVQPKSRVKKNLIPRRKNISGLVSRDLCTAIPIICLTVQGSGTWFIFVMIVSTQNRSGSTSIPSSIERSSMIPCVGCFREFSL
jgi:hypothetical protein